MFGAVMAKRQIRKGYEAINRRDLDCLMSLFADCGVFEFPTDTVLGGRHEGREAIRTWFETWFDRMSEIEFTLRHVSVENIFALGTSNVAYAEWDVVETDTEGNTYRLTGITAFEIEDGKAKYVKDYIFDQDVISSLWPRREAVGA